MDHGRRSPRHAWLTGSLIVLVALIVGGTLSLRAGAQRPIAHADARLPAIVTPAAAKSMPESPLLVAAPEEPKASPMVSGLVSFETPTLEVTTGGAEAAPFKTHHNDYDLPVFLRISVGELWQKRLMAAGFQKTFEIGRLAGLDGYLSVLVHLEEIRGLVRGQDHGGLTPLQVADALGWKGE